MQGVYVNKGLRERVTLSCLRNMDQIIAGFKRNLDLVVVYLDSAEFNQDAIDFETLLGVCFVGEINRLVDGFYDQFPEKRRRMQKSQQINLGRSKILRRRTNDHQL